MLLPIKLATGNTTSKKKKVTPVTPEEQAKGFASLEKQRKIEEQQIAEFIARQNYNPAEEARKRGVSVPVQPYEQKINTGQTVGTPVLSGVESVQRQATEPKAPAKVQKTPQGLVKKTIPTIFGDVEYIATPKESKIFQSGDINAINNLTRIIAKDFEQGGREQGLKPKTTTKERYIFDEVNAALNPNFIDEETRKGVKSFEDKILGRLDVLGIRKSLNELADYAKQSENPLAQLGGGLLEGAVNPMTSFAMSTGNIVDPNATFEERAGAVGNLALYALPIGQFAGAASAGASGFKQGLSAGLRNAIKVGTKEYAKNTLFGNLALREITLDAVTRQLRNAGEIEGNVLKFKNELRREAKRSGVNPSDYLKQKYQEAETIAQVPTPATTPIQDADTVVDDALKSADEAIQGTAPVTSELVIKPSTTLPIEPTPTAPISVVDEANQAADDILKSAFQEESFIDTTNRTREKLNAIADEDEAWLEQYQARKMNTRQAGFELDDYEAMARMARSFAIKYGYNKIDDALQLVIRAYKERFGIDVALTDKDRQAITNAVNALEGKSSPVSEPPPTIINADDILNLSREPWQMTRQEFLGEGIPAYKGLSKINWKTNQPIQSVDATQIGKKTAGFFSSDKAVAEKFAKTLGLPESTQLTEARIKFNRPYEIDAQGRPAKDFMTDALNPANNNPELVKALESPDYDGLIIRNTSDEGTIYVPKTAEQIRADITHRASIEQALAEGKLVPENVLADYPDLISTSSPASEPPLSASMTAEQPPIPPTQTATTAIPEGDTITSGISNKANLSSAELGLISEAPEGKGRPASQVVQDAISKNPTDDQLLLLANKVQNGQALNADDTALLLVGQGRFNLKVFNAREALSQAINAGASQQEIDVLQNAWLQAQDDATNFAKQIQRGKSGWSDVGRVLQQKTDLFTGELSQIKANIIAEAELRKGKTLTDAERESYIKLIDTYIGKNKALEEELAKLKQMRGQATQEGRVRRTNTGANLDRMIARKENEIRVNKAEVTKKLNQETRIHAATKVGQLITEMKLLNLFSRGTDVGANLVKMADNIPTTGVGMIVDRAVSRALRTQPLYTKNYLSYDRWKNILTNASEKIVADAKIVMAGGDADTIEKFGGTFGIGGRLAGLTDVPFKAVYYEDGKFMAADVKARQFLKDELGAGNFSKKDIDAKRTEILDNIEEYPDIIMDAENYALTETFNNKNWASKLNTKITVGMKPAGRETYNEFIGRFSKVLTNVATDIADRTGLGVGRGIYLIRDAIKNDKALSVAEQLAITKMISKGIIGIPLMYLGYKNWDKITGEIKGKTNKYIDYGDLAKLGGPVAIFLHGAAIGRAYNDNKLDKEKAENFAFSSSLALPFNTPLIGNIKDIADVLADPSKRNVAIFAAKKTSNLILPSMVRDIATRMDGNLFWQTGMEPEREKYPKGASSLEIFKGEFQSKIPGLRQQLPTKGESTIPAPPPVRQ